MKALDGTCTKNGQSAIEKNSWKKRNIFAHLARYIRKDFSVGRTEKRFACQNLKIVPANG
jgi:hypothetical protein